MIYDTYTQYHDQVNEFLSELLNFKWSFQLSVGFFFILFCGVSSMLCTISSSTSIKSFDFHAMLKALVIFFTLLLFTQLFHCSYCSGLLCIKPIRFRPRIWMTWNLVDFILSNTKYARTARNTIEKMSITIPCHELANQNFKLNHCFYWVVQVTCFATVLLYNLYKYDAMCHDGVTTENPTKLK